MTDLRLFKTGLIRLGTWRRRVPWPLKWSSLVLWGMAALVAAALLLPPA